MDGTNYQDWQNGRTTRAEQAIGGVWHEVVATIAVCAVVFAAVVVLNQLGVDFTPALDAMAE